MSPKRARALAEKRARKAAYKPSNSGTGNSVYARKCRGIYPPNSPYRTVWAKCVRGGRES